MGRVAPTWFAGPFRHHRWYVLGTAVALVFGVALAGAVGGAVVLLSGTYNTEATRQHFAVTHWVLEHGLRYSVRSASRHIVTPPLGHEEQLRIGATCFRQHCVTCHGAPGIAPDAFALGLLPVPTSLAQATRDWQPRELYWLISKGVRMTGMPAWEYRISAQGRWATVAFLEVLPGLTREDYARISAEGNETCPPARDNADLAPVRTEVPDARRAAIQQYGCIACHRMEGVVGPPVDVGPPLKDWGRHRFIAGVIPNSPENLLQWIRDPASIDPDTLMPDLGVTEAHAREIVSFMYAPDSGTK